VKVAARHVFAVQRRLVHERHVVAVAEILDIEFPIGLDRVGSTGDADHVLGFPGRGALGQVAQMVEQ
jgi:hypothetical protein